MKLWNWTVFCFILPANGRFGLSTLPAASILQLNYPMNGIQTSSTAPCLSTSSRDPSSTKKVIYQQQSSANAAGQLKNTISVPATNSVASFSVAAANTPGPSFVGSSVSSLYVNRPNFVGVNHCRPADNSVPVGLPPRCPPIVITGQRLAARTSSQVLLRTGGVPCSGDKTTRFVETLILFRYLSWYLSCSLKCSRAQIWKRCCVRGLMTSSISAIRNNTQHVLHHLLQRIFVAWTSS